MWFLRRIAAILALVAVCPVFLVLMIWVGLLAGLIFGFGGGILIIWVEAKRFMEYADREFSSPDDKEYQEIIDNARIQYVSERDYGVTVAPPMVILRPPNQEPVQKGTP